MYQDILVLYHGKIPWYCTMVSWYVPKHGITRPLAITGHPFTNGTDATREAAFRAHRCRLRDQSQQLPLAAMCKFLSLPYGTTKTLQDWPMPFLLMTSLEHLEGEGHPAWVLRLLCATNEHVHRTLHASCDGGIALQYRRKGRMHAPLHICQTKTPKPKSQHAQQQAYNAESWRHTCIRILTIALVLRV